MSVEKRIKEELLKEIYGNVDRLYDFMEQHFVLSKAQEELVIKQLNRLKDQLYIIATDAPLS